MLEIVFARLSRNLCDVIAKDFTSVIFHMAMQLMAHIQTCDELRFGYVYLGIINYRCDEFNSTLDISSWSCLGSCRNDLSRYHLRGIYKQSESTSANYKPYSLKKQMAFFSSKVSLPLSLSLFSAHCTDLKAKLKEK